MSQTLKVHVASENGFDSFAISAPGYAASGYHDTRTGRSNYHSVTSAALTPAQFLDTARYLDGPALKAWSQYAAESRNAQFSTLSGDQRQQYVKLVGDTYHAITSYQKQIEADPKAATSAREAFEKSLADINKQAGSLAAGRRQLFSGANDQNLVPGQRVVTAQEVTAGGIVEGGLINPFHDKLSPEVLSSARAAGAGLKTAANDSLNTPAYRASVSPTPAVNPAALAQAQVTV